MSKLFIIFGRITAEQPDCESILKNFYFSSDMLACMENADDGCSRTHCHFIARTDRFKNLKTLRQSFSDLCKKTLGEALRYSVKEYDESKDAEAYICKGSKSDASVTPNVFINTYGIDVQEMYDKFHETASKIRQNKHTKAIWKEVIDYIEGKDPKFFKQDFSNKVKIRIASYLYDYYLDKGRIIQGKYVQQMILQTIIANKFNSKDLKKSVILSWCDDLAYWNGMENTFNPNDMEDLDSDL